MGSSYGTIKPERTSQVLQSYAKYLPDVLRATSAQAPYQSQQELAAAQATEPGYQQLNADLTRQYAPQLAGINTAIQRQQALGGSETVAQQLEGPGAEAARAATALSRETNPDFWEVQNAASNKAKDVLNSIDLHGLSPGEAAAVERSLAQTNTATGNLGLINPTNTIANALNFGGAFNNKIGLANNAITTATGTAANAASGPGFNPVNIALGQPGTTGLTQFQQSGTQPGAAQGVLSFGSGLLGNQFGMNTAAESAAASRANTNSVPGYLGSMPSYS